MRTQKARVGCETERRHLLGAQTRAAALPGSLDVLESSWPMRLVNGRSMEIGGRMALRRMRVDELGTRVVLTTVPWGNHLKIEEVLFS